MKLEQERLNDFQARMNEWVSKQGLLFQLRYSGNIKGAKSTFFHTLGQLFLRLLLVLVIGALGFWGYLAKRVDLTSFKSALKADLTEGLNAETIELKGVKRKRGMLKLGAINMIGDESSAFEDLEARDVQILMGLADGFLRPWSGDTLEVAKLTAFLKGGSTSDELGREAYESLFWESENLSIRAIKIAEVNLKWGYSKSNQGRLVGSKLVATRKGNGWSLLFTGGRFSQNWLRDLELVRMEVELSPDGLYIHESRFKQGEADIAFSLKKTSKGMTPEFEGRGSFQGMAMTDLIGDEYGEILNGEFSAEFQVTGSTNTQSGFKYVVDVSLQEEDRIELQDGLALLRAISTADYLRSYRKVRLTEGGFRLILEPGKITVEDIALVASRLMRLEGGFSVRPPLEEELPEDLVVTERDQLLNFGEDSENTAESAFAFSLRKAAMNSNGTEVEKDSLLFSNKQRENIEEELVEDARTRALQRVYLDGDLRVGVLPSSFERSPKLSKEFPVDEARDLRWINLPLNGESPFKIGDDLSKKIYDLSASDR